MTVAEYETAVESDVTPSDLKAMRLRLGLSPDELAQLLGPNIKAAHVQNMEKGRTWIMRQGHHDFLWDLEETFQRMLDDVLQWYRPGDVLIGYPNDGVFRDYDPHVAEQIHFNSVHRMLLARVQAVLARDLPSIVEIIPTRFQDWLATKGAKDTPEERQRWAKEHMGVYKIMAGMPSVEDN